MYKKVVINGRFMAKKITGMERYAYEVVKALDKLVIQNSVELVVPVYSCNNIQLENIKIIRYGKIKSHLWEQTNLLWYLIKNNALCVSFCSLVPLLRPGIATIHDISYKVNPNFFTTKSAKLSMRWHRLHYFVTKLFAKKIFTVSEFSKQQLNNVYHIAPHRICVAGNAWQHIERIKTDETIYDKWPKLKKNSFYFSLGSLAPNKNIEWILKASKNNKDDIFCIAGNSDVKSYGSDYSAINLINVIFLGYIKDEQVKTLMRDCKAFILPSYYEGFGLPPLEAMSVGAKVIVSNTSCLKEIYENTVYYIEPNNPHIDLNELMKRKVEENEKILLKYNWDKTAKIIWNEINLLKAVKRINRPPENNILQ